MSSILIPHSHSVSHAERIRIKNHQPAVIWFTGLSGSGKSTLANQVDRILNHVYRAHTYLLDGDNIRLGLNKGLSFSAEDRAENIRRISEVARLFYDAGLLTLTAFISPFRSDRDGVRSLLPQGAFIEIYVHCSLQTCEQRDPKGLYKKARQGLIPEFTGVDSPYEAPLQPEILLDTETCSPETCAQTVIQYLSQQGVISQSYGE